MPILLTKDVVNAIDLIIKLRSVVGVAKDKTYLFPAPTKASLSSLRGYQCINNVIARVDGVEKPKLIKSTKLRKYVATVAQIINLEGNEVTIYYCKIGSNTYMHSVLNNSKH